MPLERLLSMEATLRRDMPGLKVAFGAFWGKVTTAGVGLGDIVLAEPASLPELENLLRLCSKSGFEVSILGGGSNIIGSDSSLEKVFIKLRSDGFGSLSQLDGGVIEAGAAARLSELASFAAERSLGGLAGLSGIPGTVGGAVVMNAGANGVSVSDFLLSLEGVMLGDASLWSSAAESLKWGYRESGLPKGLILTKAVFKLKESSRDRELDLIRDERTRRGRCTPQGRSAGSVFKNPSGSLSAGLLADRCGLKGRERGAAKVSPAHANWIVCQGTCPESDFTGLAAEIAMEVATKTGVALMPEVRFAQMSSRDKVVEAARPLKVVVLKGGDSSEREVSLESGGSVAKALREAGHNVEEIDLRKPEVTPEMRRADVVFPVLHGGFGEDGRIQELLEKNNIKFVGCPSSACRTIMDKLASKKLMLANGISTAAYAELSSVEAPLPEGFSYPVIVKPPSEGSTVGITLVEDASAWRPALQLALKYSKIAIVEKFIKGVESTVGVLLGQPLPLVEIRYPGKIYDYDAKYTHALGETRYICPPTGIPEAAQRHAQELALKFFKAVGARDMLRVDVIIGDDGFFCVLEGNSIPGFTASSLLPKAAKAAGMSFAELCAKLVASAASR